MTSRLAEVGRKWLKTAATTAATSALVLGGGIAAASPSQASEDHDGHEGHEGGDACEFFLEHMWANEDGIPLLGSFSHLNEYHTDPVYENLVLTLASGAIGNSEMPIIDVYGGPLGWIPVFNPSHVKGHNTDYVTLLTSCGGIGIPLDSNDLTDLDVPSVEELADLSELIVPGLPDPDMLTDPDYLWDTLDASAILNRVSPETLLNVDEYVGFAGDHFDTWRLLWETAVDDVASGNPTGILELLEITENVNTLQSLADVVGDNALGELLGEEELGALLDEGGLHSALELQDLLEQGELEGLLEGGELDSLLELEGALDDGGLEDVVGGGGLDGLLGDGGLDGVLEQDGVDGLLELDGLVEEGGLESLGLDTLLGDGALPLDGLLGGGAPDEEPGQPEDEEGAPEGDAPGQPEDEEGAPEDDDEEPGQPEDEEGAPEGDAPGQPEDEEGAPEDDDEEPGQPEDEEGAPEGDIPGLPEGEEPGEGAPGQPEGEEPTNQFSVLFSGTEESTGLGQCDATLAGNSLTVNCLYAGMASEVTSVTLNTGDDALELTDTGDVSGAASGTFELSTEQLEALEAGEATVTVNTADAPEGELDGAVEGCSCNE